MKPITLLALLLLVSPALLANDRYPQPPPEQHKDNDNKGKLAVGVVLGVIGFAIGYSWDAKPKERVEFGIQVKPGEK